jgi:hypothetical protein
MSQLKLGMGEEAARRAFEAWGKDKPELPQLSAHLDEIIRTDINRVQRGLPGLGVIEEDGTVDLDNAWDLCRRTHPLTRRKVRKRERQDAEDFAALKASQIAEGNDIVKRRQELARRNETAAQTIRRSIDELRARG